MFARKILPDSRAEMIIREQTNVESKSAIVDQIFNETGLRIHRMTVYEFQKKLGLL